MGVGELQAGISVGCPPVRLSARAPSVGMLWCGGEVDTIFGFKKKADALG